MIINIHDNKVIATATFASDFVMPSGSYQSPFIIPIDIDGTASFIGEADDFVSVDMEEAQVTDELSEEGEVKDSPESE